MKISRGTAAFAATLGSVLAVRAIARRAKKYPLANAVAFITGGSRGLGLAIATEFARRGPRIAITGRDEAALQRAAQRLRDRGADVLTIVCDVRRQPEVQAALHQAARHFRKIDFLVNNAGTIAVGPAESLTRDDYEDAMNTHFWGMYYAVEAALPLFAEQGRGRIVNVTSIGARVAVPHLLAYCTSKFAAAGYSQGLRAELARKNIAVTTVFPGLMRTGSPRNAWFKSQNTKEYSWFTISDTLPGVSIAASSAARAIVRAAERGDAEVVLSIPAKLAVFAHGLAPGVVSQALSIAARLLPAPGGIGKRRARGSESTTAVTESPLTLLGKKAEREYNQIP